MYKTKANPDRKSHVLLWLTILQEKRIKLVEQMKKKNKGRSDEKSPQLVTDGVLEIS